MAAAHGSRLAVLAYASPVCTGVVVFWTKARTKTCSHRVPPSCAERPNSDPPPYIAAAFSQQHAPNYFCDVGSQHGPRRAALEGLRHGERLELRRHDTLWGGAIQFVDAASKAA